MILLVPISPEVPKRHSPVLWPALLLVLLLGIGFLIGQERTQADFEYINSAKSFLVKEQERGELSDAAQELLRKRPLLTIAPAKGDWDLPRLLLANFLHGSLPHLLLNWIGLFAGARICTPFLPFYLNLTIFLLGGSLGLLTSLSLSAEASAYIPHIGASGGIFALMGSYYVYNFRYRTKYFFWFPGRHGATCLKTSWFFFVDVILLELVLSTGQFLPERVDSVDHLAHVVGFGAGLLLAYGLRFLQGWPEYIQTRAEYLLWKKAPHASFEKWVEWLDLNPYNDRAKIHLCDLIRKNPKRWDPSQIQTAFSFFSPTFIRLHTQEAAQIVSALLRAEQPLPQSWLAWMPYDTIIRLSQAMARTPDDLPLLLALVSAYRRAHPESNMERKLEGLTQKLHAAQVQRQA